LLACCRYYPQRRVTGCGMAVLRAGLVPLLALLLISQAISAGAQHPVYPSPISIMGYARVPALAVSMLENGSYIGSISWIEVRILAPGSGTVYVSTEPLSDIDLQASGRAAVLIASYLANIDPFKYDYLISVRASAPIIGGPSAGSAMVAAIYSALTNTSLDPSVASTGMILPDGLIGPVGGVPEKVAAAISSGYRTILIPWGQSIYPEVRYITQSIGPIAVVRPVTVNINVSDLASRYGARVVEVASAEDLLELFTRGSYRAPEGSSTLYVAEAEAKILVDSYRYFASLQESSISSISQKTGMVGDRRVSALISSLISGSNEYRNESASLVEKGLYYPAISMIYTSYLLARYAENLVNTYTARSPSSHVDSYLSYVGSLLNRYEDLWGSLVYKKSYSVGEVFVLTEVYRRIQDARDSINASTQLASTGDIINALYYASYAEARLKSIDTWLSLLNLGAEGSVERSYVERLSSWIYSYAATSLAYLESLISSTGYQIQVSDLDEMLKKASIKLSAGDYIATIAISTDIIVNATLTIHSMFLVNVTGLSEIVKREVNRISSSLGGASPLPARLYVQMGDYLASSKSYQQAVAFYEDALLILRISRLLTSQGVSLNSAVTYAGTATNPYQIQSIPSTETKPGKVQTTTAVTSSVRSSGWGENTHLMSEMITAIAVTVTLASMALALYVYRRSRYSHAS